MAFYHMQAESIHAHCVKYGKPGYTKDFYAIIR